MIKTLFVFIVLYFHSLSAALADHFKKACDVGSDHSMPGIDFIYIINLDQRPEKFQQCMDELSPYGINPYRFSAVNGWELTLEELNDIGVKFESWMTPGIWGTYYPLDGERKPIYEIAHVIGRSYFCYDMPLGSIGVILSHLSVLQDAYDRGYNTIWVMEDDIVVIRDPRELSELIRKLDEKVGKDNWDVLFTDPDTKDKKGNYVPCFTYKHRLNFTPSSPAQFTYRNNVGPHFRRIGARYGAYSMIVRRSGMKKLLDFMKEYKIFLPYDMEYTLPPDIHLYCLRKDVVSTIPDAPTDNGKCGYLEKDK